MSLTLTGVTLTGMAIQVGSSIVSGLRAVCKAYYKLDETSGDRSDSTGHGNTLSIYNDAVGYGAGKVNNAVALDGTPTQEWLTRASTSDLQISESTTFAFWAQFNSNGYFVPFGKWNGGASDREYLMELDSGSLDFVVRKSDDSGNSVIVYSPTVTLSQWYFVVCVVDMENSQVGIELNRGGFQYASLSGGARSSSAVFDLGGNSAYAPGGMVGYLDEFGKYSGVLTSTQLDYLYNSGNGVSLY